MVLQCIVVNLIHLNIICVHASYSSIMSLWQDNKIWAKPGWSCWTGSNWRRILKKVGFAWHGHRLLWFSFSLFSMEALGCQVKKRKEKDKNKNLGILIFKNTDGQRLKVQCVGFSDYLAVKLQIAQDWISFVHPSLLIVQENHQWPQKNSKGLL